MLRACHVLTILTSRSLSRAGVVQILSRSTSKSAPNMSVLTILTSESLSRAGVVQILSRSTSKSAPTPPVFNDFDVPIALARRWVQILSTSWAADPSRHLAFRTYLCEPSKPRNYGKTQRFAQFLPAKSLLSHICAVKYLCCRTSMLRDLPATFSIVGS